MKYLFLLAAGVVFSPVSHAEEPGLEGVYASHLCHIVSAETETGSEQTYLNKMQSENARGQSPSAISKPEFSEDTAREMINGWLELDEEERQVMRGDNERCQQTLMMQLQQED